MASVTSKIFAITGGASRIGAATCRLLAERGAAVGTQVLYPSSKCPSFPTINGRYLLDLNDRRVLRDILVNSQELMQQELRANFLADGFVLCIVCNHSVFDGTGADIILEMLADCYRAEAASGISLVTTGDIESELRGFLSSASVTVPQESQAGYAISCAHMEVEAESFPTMLCNYSFLFSSEKLEQLRDAVEPTRALPLPPPRPDDAKWTGFRSSNEAFTALLAISAQRAREGAPSHTT
ncbi:hypothetical protein CNMCM8980_003680 [Aspergillus fumigatiaffinis]|uniref:Uncharacterized protein n=1 Tax=Aspergillus fumigatiaffinis TaxID=340414 RepID=A0A8H4EF72_9EURO|nr:hypothetical protein CNMCM5878_001977 [Aspergillus fumigatiaffinis]KAF4221884.1 hypothetical protein CNMCM6457_001580 [Aspergillus fumigatiaffinis]KAF4228461.1 hypothetical protein CNMCM6805_002161 [Aspergillus fumigatiaffinis]KAF4234872.1 hypothetical protein CNMCM8980_003680 [Aspergillus fumigatiaffinis]